MVDLAQYIDLFVSEAFEHLEKMETAFLSLDSDADDKNAIDVFFRHAHTLKGMAGAMGFENAYALTHALETFMTPHRQGAEPYSPAASKLANKGLKTLMELVEHVKSKKEEGDVSSDLIKDLEEHKLPDIDQAEEADAFSPASTDVRMSAETLETMSREINDTIHSFSMLSDLLARMESPEIDNLIARMDSSVNNLHNNILQLRLMPLDIILARIPGLVNQTTALIGKKAKVKIMNPHIQVDRSVIEGLGNVMLHLIRNSLDHGIEDAETRRNAGKTELGLISIKCSRDNEIVHIDISDDGGGINREKVFETAKLKNLIPDDMLERKKLSWLETVDLLCTPGFSTNSEVSTVSGRGVGLDVVKETINGLSGRFTITSEPGEGTLFSIQVPVSIARQKVLMVKSDKFNVGIPMFDIDSIKTGTIEKIMGGSFSVLFPNVAFSVHGWSLKALLTLNDAPEAKLLENRTYDFIILNTQWGKRAIWVDSILGGHDLIMRQVLHPLDKINEINMTAVLSDGTPLLVLNLSNVIEKYETQFSL